jgi:hypothetical protein
MSSNDDDYDYDEDNVDEEGRGGYRTPSSAVRGLGQGFEKLSVNAASASRNRRTPPQSTTPRAVGRHSGANNGTNVPTES